MPQPRPVLVTIATHGFQYLWLNCIESHQRYADRYGYDYDLITTNDHPELTPHWSKVKVCIALLREGRDVLLIDSDAYIRPTTPRFTDLLDREKGCDIFIAKGWSGRPNSGVVFLRAGADSMGVRFLEECLANRHKVLPEEDRVTDYGENGHFIHFLKQDPFQPKTFILDERWNRIKLRATSGDFIIHYTGPMRPPGGATDGCEPFFGRTDARRRVGLRDRVAREYYRFRWILLKLAGRLPLAAAAFDRLGALLAKSDASLPDAGPTAAGPLWKCEAFFGLRDHPTALLLRHLLVAGDVVIDGKAGAGHLGLAAAVGRTGRVIAIRAEPDTARVGGKGLPPPSRAEGNGGDASRHTGSGGYRDEILASLDENVVTLLRLDIGALEPEDLRSLCTALSDRHAIHIMMEIGPSTLEWSKIDLPTISSILYQSGFVLREIRDDYTLGPRGFINRHVDRNYISTSESGWVQLLERIRLHRA